MGMSGDTDEVGEGERVERDELGEGDDEDAHEDDGRWWLCANPG